MDGMVRLLLLSTLIVHLSHCCLTNFDSLPPRTWRKYKDVYITNIFITPKQSLRNWTLKLEFLQPLANPIKPSKGIVENENKQMSMVVLKSKDEQTFVKQGDRIMLGVSFKEKIDGEIVKYIEFCGYLEDSEENICQMDEDLEKRGKGQNKGDKERKSKNKSCKHEKERGKGKIKKEKQHKKNKYLPKDRKITTPKQRKNCLNNIIYDFKSEWRYGKYWRTSAMIKPNFNYPLKDWYIRMEFKDPLAQNIAVWNAQADPITRGKKTIILKAKHWNKISNNLNLNYQVVFRKKQGKNQLQCAEICGIVPSTRRNICQNKETTAPPTTAKASTATPKTKTTTAPTTTTPTIITAPTATTPTTTTTAPTKTTTTTLATRTTTTPTTKIITTPTTITTTTATTSPSTTTTSPPLTTTTPITTTTTSTTTASSTTTTSTPKTTTTTPTATTTTPTTTTTTSTTTRTTPTTTTTTPKTTTTTPTATTTTPTTTTTTSTTTKTTPTKTTTATLTPITTTTPTTTASSTTTVSTPLSTMTPTTTTPTPTKTTTTSKTTTTTPTTTTTTTTLAPISFCKYNYSKVLEKSLLFYEAQRSGKLPKDQRVTWRKDSALSDGSSAGFDLSGGYFYGAGYIKFGFPMASTITNLAWGMLEFKKGYESSGQFENGLKAVKWGTDYLMKCYSSPNKLVGQVGKIENDEQYWGRPEDMKVSRPVYFINETAPGSELAAETAAALAASFFLFRDQGDVSYATDCLTIAKKVYNFAMKYRGVYNKAITGGSFYRSSGYRDELAWASLWLYRATNDEVYRNNFENQFAQEASTVLPTEFSWDNKWFGVKILAQQMQIDSRDYMTGFKTFLENGKKTPKGLYYVSKYGPLRHASNFAFLSLMASKIKDKEFYNHFANQQLNYMLGDAGRSFVVGYGVNPPQRPHHRSSSCPSSGQCNFDQLGEKGPNPQILYGALVGGPNEDDQFTDNRFDYIKNEVSLDFNAGFQSALAGHIELAQYVSCVN